MSSHKWISKTDRQERTPDVPMRSIWASVCSFKCWYISSRTANSTADNTSLKMCICLCWLYLVLILQWSAYLTSIPGFSRTKHLYSVRGCLLPHISQLWEITELIKVQFLFTIMEKAWVRNSFVAMAALFQYIPVDLTFTVFYIYILKPNLGTEIDPNNHNWF